MKSLFFVFVVQEENKAGLKGKEETKMTTHKQMFLGGFHRFSPRDFLLWAKAGVGVTPALYFPGPRRKSNGGSSGVVRGN